MYHTYRFSAAPKFQKIRYWDPLHQWEKTIWNISGKVTQITAKWTMKAERTFHTGRVPVLVAAIHFADVIIMNLEFRSVLLFHWVLIFKKSHCKCIKQVLTRKILNGWSGAWGPPLMVNLFKVTRIPSQHSVPRIWIHTGKLTFFFLLHYFIYVIHVSLW